MASPHPYISMIIIFIISMYGSIAILIMIIKSESRKGSKRLKIFKGKNRQKISSKKNSNIETHLPNFEWEKAKLSPKRKHSEEEEHKRP